jgi:hypothetical protein
VNKTKGARQQEKAQPETVLGYGEPQEVFTLPGELLEVRGESCTAPLCGRDVDCAYNRSLFLLAK